MKIHKYHKTTNFYWACFLYAKGCEIAGINNFPGTSKAEFVFVKPPDINIWLEIFNFGKENAPEMLIDSRKLIQAIRELKDKLYADRAYDKK